MKIGIIAAMEEEAHILIKCLEGHEVSPLYDFEFHQGHINGQAIVLLKAGVGKVNTAIGATLMINYFGVTHLINTGSAGGIGAGLAIGDVVIAKQLAYHDVDVTAFDYQYGQMAGMPHYYDSDERLNEIAKEVVQDLGLKLHQGLIVSGDSFVQGSELLARIRHFYPQALACEMEAAAVGQVAYVLKVPFLVIRAISDGGDDQAAMSFDEFIQLAGKQSAQVVITILTKLKNQTNNAC